MGRPRPFLTKMIFFLEMMKFCGIVSGIFCPNSRQKIVEFSA